MEFDIYLPFVLCDLDLIRNMDILYITNHLNIGGITSYCLTLAAGMKQRGHNVYIASSGGQLFEQFKEKGIEYLHIPIRTKSEISPKILLSFFKLRSFIKKNHIDILHAHSRTTQVLAEFLGRKTGAPYISTCHGFFKARFSRRKFPCWGLKTIAISEAVKEHLLRDFKLDAENIKVIPNGVDVSRFSSKLKAQSSKLKEKLGLEEDAPVIGIVGRLSDVKGHRYLIQAMPEVLKAYPLAQLLIVGDGKIKKDLLKLSKELVLDEHIIFLPSVQDTSEVLQALDIFVMPSLQEGLGLALMEAMASGLPVVASGVGGIGNLIHDGENGILVQPADIKSLSCAIIGLLDNKDNAVSLGDSARRFVTENFSEENMISETEALYSEVLKG